MKRNLQLSLRTRAEMVIVTMRHEGVSMARACQACGIAQPNFYKAIQRSGNIDLELQYAKLDADRKEAQARAARSRVTVTERTVSDSMGKWER